MELEKKKQEKQEQLNKLAQQIQQGEVQLSRMREMAISLDGQIKQLDELINESKDLNNKKSKKEDKASAEAK